jgi:hypothetical protein
VTAVVRCHSAADPVTRPDCQLLAVLRYGPIPLCASCDRQRSSLGKGVNPIPVPQAAPLDVSAWIEQAQRDLRQAERALVGVVRRARQRGHSWTTIGAALGVSRQAAQQRFPEPVAQPDGANSGRQGGAR